MTEPDGTARQVMRAAEKVLARAGRVARAAAGEVAAFRVPGAPGSEPPTVAEPTEPREPLPPKEDQAAPALGTATGLPVPGPPAARAQQGEFLTTSQGARLRDTDHSLTVGDRGPVLLQDHHLREKITHFDHERIPERVVHARGAGAHGVFVGYGNAAPVCHAAFLGEGVETPVFVRFSTVLGSRGSADTVRDTRGFATKFYTAEGTFDLVGNNMPVFFIQDGIKFPDVVHAAKPHPDREIPQAQSAHDTFWDFASLHTEAQHHTMWAMSDRGIPRSFRMMEGFGVHTFRTTDAAGATALVKFHWKPRLGVHSLVWEEAQVISGADPDFHRRDLADAIEAGAYPQWELGLQVFPDTPDETFEGIDLLDPTKLVPEELAPVQPVGLLTLTRNPSNFFAETEQVAFHVGHLVPGIDVTNDRLLQARLFSYVDTQLIRLGGPNFSQIPINRPHAPVNDMLRDGYHQHAVHTGVAPYRPNSLDGGCPFTATAAQGAFVDLPVQVPAAPKVRQGPEAVVPESFPDHFTQARRFWLSMSAVERAHIVQAYTFELSRCYEQAVRERQLLALVRIDGDLARRVAAGLGLPVPQAPDALPDVTLSPALSQVGQAWPVDGRVVGIVVEDAARADLDVVRQVREAVVAASAVPFVVAPHGGTLADGTSIQRTVATTRSVEFDALLVAGSPPPVPSLYTGWEAPDAQGAVDPRLVAILTECYRHSKALGAWGSGVSALEAAGVRGDTAGVVTGEDPAAVTEGLLALLREHRAWERWGPA